jgi:hypothetical protein
MDAIGNYKERNNGRMPFDGDQNLMDHLQQHVSPKTVLVVIDGKTGMCHTAST